MKQSTKKLLPFAAIAVTCGAVVVGSHYRKAFDLDAPTLLSEEEPYDAERIKKKLGSWSTEEASAYQALIDSKAKTRGSRAEIDQQGRWINRGPFNMPGAWNLATIDVGTDTVYAATCGHYGGVQTIWKGTVPNEAMTKGGNDYKMLPGTGRNPSRYRDISVFHKNGVKAIVYTVENGGVYYSFDDGVSFTKSTGLPAMLMNTVVDRKTATIYTTDGVDIFTSTDMGVSFSKLLTLGASQQTRLYTPLFDSQPGYGTVFVQYGTAFKMITGTTTRTMGSVPGPIEASNFHIGGDTRTFIVTSQNAGGLSIYNQNYFVSTDTGKTWVTRNPSAHYYDGVCALTPFAGLGVGISNPNYVVGGYAHPSVSDDALATTYENDLQWGWYQVGWSTMAEQQVRLKNYYHPDFQSTAFYLDSEGKEFSLWMSDGGLFINRSVFLNPPIMKDCENYGFKNIMLGGGSAVTETYKFGMISGTKGPVDFALGTQDQGVQTSQPGLVGEMAQVIQSPGGDGAAWASGPDGLYGWEIGDLGIRGPFPLYNGETFTGQKQTGAASSLSINVTNIWHDLKDYATTIWIMNTELTKVVLSGKTLSTSTKAFGNIGFVSAMCQSPVSTSTYWVLDVDKVYKTTDGGNTFGAPVNVPITVLPSGNNARGWAFNDTTILFAGRSGTTVNSILSTDGGATWSTVPGLTDVDIRWMQGDKNGTVAMASTPIGPYLFDLSAKKWIDAAGDINTGVPYFNGQWGAYIPSTNTFRFSTWGFGVWDFEINDGLPKLSAIAAIPATVKQGENVTVDWTTNQTGTVTIDLMKNGTKVATVGTADYTAKTFTWVVDSKASYGSGYSLRLSLGNLSSTTTSFAIMPDLILIPQDSLSVESFDSEGNNTSEAAANTLDGNLNTFWHTSYASGYVPYPHEIVYSLSGFTSSTLVEAFSYTPRNDGPNGRIKNFEFFVSTDNTNWTKAASGSFTNSGSEEIVLFDNPVLASNPLYVKLVGLSEINGNAWCSMAEFNLYRVDGVAISDKIKGLTGNTLFAVNGITSHSLSLSLPAADQVNMQIVSLNGRVLAQRNILLNAGVHSIPFADYSLASGPYIVKISGRSLGTITKKLFIY